MERMKTSVVLTTYNGEKYIEDLIKSLFCQTRKIDEVLIFDDCSTDNTIKIITNFISLHKLENWKLHINRNNKGWIKNFRDGVLLATGDVIFPCDQDDIWNCQKIEIMADLLKSNNKILVLTSDYAPMYEVGSHKVDSLNSSKIRTLEFIRFSSRFSKLLRPGCVFAIRKSFLDEVSNFWEDWYPHDAFLWTAACILDGSYLLHKPLIRYRRHANNASDGVRHFSDVQINATQRTINVVIGLRDKYTFSPRKNRILNKYLSFADYRIKLLKSHNIFLWIKMIMYMPYYRSFKQWLGDLYYIIRGC